MKNTIKLTLFTAALGAITTLSACKKDDKEAGGSGKANEPAKEAKETKEAKAAPVIEGFGLAFDGPADSQINDMTMGSAKTYMVMGTGLVFSVAEPSDMSPKTLEEAVEASKIYDGATITKQDKTADGYHLEFNNKGSMGANYFIEIRRTIGEKPYICSTTAPDAAMASAAVAACQSLRAK